MILILLCFFILGNSINLFLIVLQASACIFFRKTLSIFPFVCWKHPLILRYYLHLLFGDFFEMPNYLLVAPSSPFLFCPKFVHQGPLRVLHLQNLCHDPQILHQTDLLLKHSLFGMWKVLKLAKWHKNLFIS